ncbi:MAG: efflux RND transporter periplasmic adaptor subunit [Chlorobi bacterium]|nr:efflux RND transporter periplasmic adaptor subunit [Chlorobiota bacterium]
MKNNIISGLLIFLFPYFKSKAARCSCHNKYGVFLLLILFLFSCSKGEKKEEYRQIPAVKISVADVVKKNMQDTIVFYGDVRLRRDVRMASQFDGRLEEFSLLPGDRVRKGERIGIIVPPMREALLQVIEQIPPDKREMISGEIKEVPLFSPIDGVVLEVSRHTGDVVQRGEEIVHIGCLKVLDVYGDVPLRYLKQINGLKELAVSFVDYSEESLILKIEAIGGKMDMGKNTVPVRLSLNNSKGEYKPGMMVKLAFPGIVHKNALIVPRSAVLNEEGVYSVFVLKGDNTVEKRVIKPGIIQNNIVEVLSGLKERERVATTKAYSLVDGMVVEKM